MPWVLAVFLIKGLNWFSNPLKAVRFLKTEIWKNLVDRVKGDNKVFHFIGLLSDGGCPGQDTMSYHLRVVRTRQDIMSCEP